MNDNYDATAQEAYNNIMPTEVDNPFQVYLCGDKFYIYKYLGDRNKWQWFPNVPKMNMRLQAEQAGLTPREVESKARIVHRVQYRVNYFRQSGIECELNLCTMEEVLTKYINPSEEWTNVKDYDKDIVDDYKQIIFENKLDELIELIILSIKYPVSLKKSSLLLTGISDKGKSEVFRIIGMYEMKGQRFESIVSGNRQIGQAELDGIQKVGMILIDELNGVKDMNAFKSLEPDIKLSQLNHGEQYIHIDFYAITSAVMPFDGADDEQANRTMHMALESEDVLTTRPLFLKDRERYKEETTKYIKSKMLEVLKGDLPKVRLYELQEKYKLSTDTVDAIKRKVLEEVRSEIVMDSQLPVSSLGLVKTKSGLKVETKGKIAERIRELVAEHSKGTSIQYHKIAHQLTMQVVGTQRVGGKYYEITIYA